MGIGINARANPSCMPARIRGERVGRGSRARWSAKRIKQSRREKDEERWQKREGGWKEGKAGAERQKETERAGNLLGSLWLPHYQLQFPRGLNLLYIYDASISF